ncbi:MAG: helix-turn-helix transcriptional regulator [Lachnospiraceae bacterium]|nr:helix-turn-helix transcriptional regulator [Lachnospiraceae bacterium]
MDQKKIGSFLRELRREQAITQEQFAEKLGVSARTVSRCIRRDCLASCELRRRTQVVSRYPC